MDAMWCVFPEGSAFVLWTDERLDAHLADVLAAGGSRAAACRQLCDPGDGDRCGGMWRLVRSARRACAAVDARSAASRVQAHAPSSGSALARGGTVRRGVKRTFQRMAADVDAEEEAELRRLEDGDPDLDA